MKKTPKILEEGLTDAKGNTYRLVSSFWMKVITALSILNFVVLMLIIAGLIDNIQMVRATMTFSDKMNQRNLALSDIAASRAKANIWAFNESCDYAKKQGRECPNVVWYADPKRYPLIVDDETGAGLFPPKEK